MFICLKEGGRFSNLLALARMMLTVSISKVCFDITPKRIIKPYKPTEVEEVRSAVFFFCSSGLFSVIGGISMLAGCKLKECERGSVYKLTESIEI